MIKLRSCLEERRELNVGAERHGNKKVLARKRGRAKVPGDFPVSPRPGSGSSSWLPRDSLVFSQKTFHSH